MEKKKLFSAILALLTVFYCVNTYFIFDGERRSLLEEFNRNTRYLNELCLDIVNKDYSIDRVTEEVATIGFGFPTAAILYDSEGNVVSKSGAHIKLEKEEIFCRIDDYLTSDIRKQITDFEEEHGFYVCGLDYNIRNDEIIPVSMTMHDSNGQEDLTEKVVFSDEKAEYSAEYVTDYFNPESWIIDESHHNHDFYQTLCEETFSEDVWNGVSDEIAEWTGDSIETADYFYSGNLDEYFTTEFYNIDGEKYVLHIRSEFNPYIETLFSDDFVYLQGKLTFIYLLIGAVVLYFANKTYNKYILSRG